MNNPAARIFTKALEASDIKYQVVNEEKEIIRVGWGFEGGDISVFFQFDSDAEGVHIVGLDFIKIPSAAADKMYKVVNDLNKQYRWIKFTYDNSDNSVTAECDAAIQLDSCAEEVIGLMVRMVRIVEGAYPEIMKSLWA